MNHLWKRIINSQDFHLHGQDPEVQSSLTKPISVSGPAVAHLPEYQCSSRFRGQDDLELQIRPLIQRTIQNICYNKASF